jgi:hypothetical protein
MIANPFSALLSLTPRGMTIDAWERIVATDLFEGGAVPDLILREPPPFLLDLAWDESSGRTLDARAEAAAELVLQWSLRSLEVGV